MAYQAEISRTNPTLFVFLLDQSGSMKDSFGGQTSYPSKAAGVADAINRILSNLIIRCSEGEETRDYFDVAILGYGAKVGEVKPALGGSLAGKDIITLNELADNPIRVEDRIIKQPDGAGGVVDTPVKFPIWFEAVSGGDTPMSKALRQAHRVAQNWSNSHRNAFPPIVINLTDGEATDESSKGELLGVADELKKLSTNDGNVLLFNCHIASDKSSPVLYPDTDSNLPNEYGKQLFKMSSLLTPTMNAFAQKEGFPVTPKSRGFVFQADLVDLVRFLDIGTRPADIAILR